MSVTFEVSPVEEGKLRLALVPAQEAIAQACNSVVVESRQQPEVAPDGVPCEGWSPVGDLYITRAHAFVGAIQVAFDHHLPLELSPDQVWILIAQGAATHINLYPEQFREWIVGDSRQRTLRVRRDDFVSQNSDNPWPEVVDAFADELAVHVGRRRDLFVSDFSTTDEVARTVSQMVLMSAMQRYFHYRFMSKCGIPRITLHGTVEDWRSVRARAQVLRELELGTWLASLDPILEQFVEAAASHVDREHWRSIYKINDRSGGPYVTGWLQVLFPYLSEPSAPNLVPNDELAIWRKAMAWPLGGGPTFGEFPGGMHTVPFEWEYIDRQIPMELLSGFAGVRQTPSGAVTPQLGWGVRRRSQ